MSTARPILPGCEVMPAMRPAATKKAHSRPTRNGRFAVLNNFVDASLRRIGGSAAKVWLILYRDTKPNGLVRAADADLARRAGVSDRTVRDARRELVEAGLLVVVRQGGFRKGASTYRVRSLPEAGFRLLAEESCQTLRKQASYIPERDQNGSQTHSGSDSFTDRQHAAVLPVGQSHAESPPASLALRQHAASQFVVDATNQRAGGQA
jgi:hypothetical protein